MGSKDYKQISLYATKNKLNVNVTAKPVEQIQF